MRRRVSLDSRGAPAMTVLRTSASLVGMATGPWTDEENDLIVADYFAMLASDLAGRPYIKAEHNRRLRTRIDRSRPSIEFKHRNISAVLKGLGESWIAGYLPAFNVQMSLADTVARWLHRHPEFQTPEVRATQAGRSGDGTARHRVAAYSQQPPPA